MKYPDAARENNIEGRVIVKFVVNEDGKISDIQIARSLERSCDEEAKRVVASMPPWKPGKQNGKAVKVLFNLPIVFKLE
jgi:protein TonB